MEQSIKDLTLYKGNYLITKKDVPTNSLYLHKVHKRGVQIIPLLTKNKQHYILLIKSFRFPIRKYIYEFPGGLLDENETILQCALRELKEETGWVGSEASLLVSDCFTNPQLADGSTDMVLALIDGNAEANRKQKQQLDELEDIETELVELGRVDEFVRENLKNQPIGDSLLFFLKSLNSFLPNK